METAGSDIEIDLMELADIGQPFKLAVELHRQLRKQFGSVPPRVPLASIAKAVGIVGIKEFNTDEFEGTLVIQDGAGAIGLRRGLRSSRRNFTLGHEIGHFLIPNHRFQGTRFECAKVDMRRDRAGENWDARPAVERIEVEANEFSAALLVPVPEYQNERRRLGSSSDVSHIRSLAEVFDVSQEMMAKIYVNSADDKIAIITSHNGQVKRIIPKTGFPYLGLRGGVPVPNGALTRNFKSLGNDTISDLNEVPIHTWLERKGNVTALYEQVFVQDEGWVMTLLMIDEDEVDEDNDDHNWNRRSKRSWST